jgi:DDE superfamily endonuclease
LSDYGADSQKADEADGFALEASTLCLLGESASHRPEKRAIVRQLRRLRSGTVVLFEDETVLRFFPPLRHSWAYKGEQAVVPITGENAKRVLFGALNFKTGHRIVLERHKQRQQDFQAFLQVLRQRYRNQPLALLLDKASWHNAAQSQALAVRLDIKLIWLPKQWSELNAMDHLWKELKRQISSNRQFKTIDEQAAYAEKWVLGLSQRCALRKAGVLSKNFWLRKV